MVSDTAGLVLAAAPGGDGEPVIALGRWGHVTVVEHLVATMRAAGVSTIVVVLGAAAEEVLDVVDLGDAIVVIDPEWEEGEAAPLRAGLDVLMSREDLDVAVLVNVRQPALSPDLVTTVVAARQDSDTLVAAPKYRYNTGHPFAIHRNLWPRLMGLEGDVRPGTFFKAHLEWTTEVWVDQVPPITVAKTEDLERIAPRA